MKRKKMFSRGRIRPLLRIRPITKKESAVLARQMKGRVFDASLVSGVAARCSFGFPTVVHCSPFKKGRPFPTSFWLTCPWLVRLCGERESEGAVGLLESALRLEPKEWTSYHLHAARLRILAIPPALRIFLRRRCGRAWRVVSGTGVGGIEYRRGGGGAKCLHLQTASWLALGAHPAEELLVRMIDPRECGEPSKWGCACSC